MYGVSKSVSSPKTKKIDLIFFCDKITEDDTSEATSYQEISKRINL